ncbi:flagellar biosynthesis anti-sigma factor FlgM [Psychrosphaera sp. F3M07]|uniref:flagellar biosynthesis anti-sigma factor FlgM n=1 Tax=Psychrosphaera sp. F3M07 TaxID=2841560 RepID=UPI001C092E3C|nr:flagellar biosynthesis anti-sigma factor FlgM [Psychrosphaera sp. F3M07]MBU2917889.1 flagellar biosynthesis anti-sigma factor FlgM [Psychrosphaera sp. F3M07]
MVNNIKNSGVNSSNNAIYQQKSQQLEQTKLDATKQNSQPDTVKSVNKDSVALTPQANQLKELQKRIGDTEAFDRKKVDDIKQALSDGQYSINYDRLASKLAAFEFEL